MKNLMAKDVTVRSNIFPPLDIDVSYLEFKSHS